MIWEKISNQHSTLQEYRLTDTTDTKLILKYNPLHRSARVTFGNHHRLFFLESTGSMSGKTIFKNEYGMETGNLIAGSSYNKGSLLIDSKDFFYNIKDNSLIIYERDMKQTLAVCNFEINNNTSAGFFNNTDITCYAIGICWYLSLSINKELNNKYAFAS